MAPVVELRVARSSCRRLSRSMGEERERAVARAGQGRERDGESEETLLPESKALCTTAASPFVPEVSTPVRPRAARSVHRRRGPVEADRDLSGRQAPVGTSARKA